MCTQIWCDPVSAIKVFIALPVSHFVFSIRDLKSTSRYINKQVIAYVGSCITLRQFGESYNLRSWGLFREVDGKDSFPKEDTQKKALNPATKWKCFVKLVRTYHHQSLSVRDQNWVS